MTDFSDFFTQLFTGTGALFGLIIVISIMILIALMHKYAGILSFSIGMLMTFQYLEANLPYEAIIMMIASLFSAIMVFTKER